MQLKEQSSWLERAKTPEEVGVSSKEVQAFVDHCGTVDGDLGSHGPVRMFQCIF